MDPYAGDADGELPDEEKQEEEMRSAILREPLPAFDVDIDDAQGGREAAGDWSHATAEQRLEQLADGLSGPMHGAESFLMLFPCEPQEIRHQACQGADN